MKDSLLLTNPTCRILEASYCQFPLDELFAVSAYKPQLKAVTQPLKSLHSEIGHAFVELEVAHSHNQWERNIGTILWENDFRILRVKGLLHVQGSDYLHQLQG